jgi:hypothetical protein
MQAALAARMEDFGLDTPAGLAPIILAGYGEQTDGPDYMAQDLHANETQRKLISK